MKMKRNLWMLLLFSIIFAACSTSKTDKANQEDEPKNNLGWEINETLDEWGDNTGRKNAIGGFMGKFSNSATSDGDVAVAIIVTTQNIGERLDTLVSIALGEYEGRHTVRDMDLKGKARNSNGDIKEFYLGINNDGFGMLISEINVDIFKFLCEGGNIDVILEEETKYGVPSKYKFTIPFYLNIPDAVAKINN